MIVNAIGIPFRQGSGEGGNISTAYVNAVQADGGTVESATCVVSSFEALNLVSIQMGSETIAYNNAVIADGGSVDNIFCVRQLFIQLNNVTLS